MAVQDMIVDHADALHVGIAHRATHEFEAALFHVLGHGIANCCGGRNIGECLGTCINDLVVRKPPKIIGKAAEFFLEL